jgi:hypothetical protein
MKRDTELCVETRAAKKRRLRGEMKTTVVIPSPGGYDKLVVEEVHYSPPAPLLSFASFVPKVKGQCSVHAPYLYLCSDLFRKKVFPSQRKEKCWWK